MVAVAVEGLLCSGLTLMNEGVAVDDVDVEASRVAPEPSSSLSAAFLGFVVVDDALLVEEGGVVGDSRNPLTCCCCRNAGRGSQGVCLQTALAGGRRRRAASLTVLASMREWCCDSIWWSLQRQGGMYPPKCPSSPQRARLFTRAFDRTGGGSDSLVCGNTQVCDLAD